MIQKMTNRDIYDYAQFLINAFQKSEIKLPIKINFYLQKNKKTLCSLAQEIEEQRKVIIREYGVINKEKETIEVPLEKISDASQKMNELFNLTQDVNIYKVKLDDFDNIKLTQQEMEALLFMIEDEIENE